MSDDVLSLVKAAQKERSQLTTKIDRLKKRETAIRSERVSAERRIGEIDTAFAPLRQTLAGANVVVAAPRETGERGGAMNEIVVAIGKFGLRDFTPGDVLSTTDLSMPTIYSLLSQLATAGRIRRISPGVYRTAQAKIA
jgi:hypothetical protein